MIVAQQQLKKAIWLACREYIEARTATAEEALAAARDASQDDTKSSAGDKYETGREMMQQEINRNERLLSEAKAMQQLLETIAPENPKPQGSIGAVIETDRGVFFLGPGIGVLDTEKGRIFVLSASSPIGRLLLSCKPGDTIRYNSAAYTVSQVF